MYSLLYFALKLIFFKFQSVRLNLLTFAFFQLEMHGGIFHSCCSLTVTFLLGECMTGAGGEGGPRGIFLLVLRNKLCNESNLRILRHGWHLQARTGTGHQPAVNNIDSILTTGYYQMDFFKDKSNLENLANLTYQSPKATNKINVIHCRSENQPMLRQALYSFWLLFTYSFWLSDYLLV